MSQNEKIVTLPSFTTSVHGESSGQVNHEGEPSWIRDALAVELEVSDPSNAFAIVAEICEGEKSYCEHCGAAFPMWPTKGWGDHILTAHSDNLTIQTRTGTALMCDDQCNGAQQLFFSMMLGARISMRRRGFQRGLLIVKPGRIVGPTN